MKSIKLTIVPETPLHIPFAHFEMLQGLFYHFLSYDKALSTEIHDKKPEDKKQFKFFCFSDLHGKYTIQNKQLIYSGAMEWEVRSANERIIDTILQAVKAESIVLLEGQPCNVVSCVLQEQHYCVNEAIVEMDTPLLYYLTEETGYSRYFAPNEEDFLLGIKNNLIRKYTAFYGNPPSCDIFICVLEDTVKKCVTRYKQTMITGYYGKFQVMASAEVLAFVYHTGLGAKNSMGFGTIK